MALHTVELHQHGLCITKMSEQNNILKNSIVGLTYPNYVSGYSPPHSIHCNIYSSQISTYQINPAQLLDLRLWHIQRDSTEKYTFRVNYRIFDCMFESLRWDFSPEDRGNYQCKTLFPGSRFLFSRWGDPPRWQYQQFLALPTAPLSLLHQPVQTNKATVNRQTNKYISICPEMLRPFQTTNLLSK